ncbi:MAG: N-acetylmuramoyl-L-alanine amidase [Paracoccaceae bacterium]|jgi:N-acetylmuramoyl-L-alanine amidase
MCNVTGIFALIGRVPAASVATLAMAIPAWAALSFSVVVTVVGVTVSPTIATAAAPQVTDVRVGVYPGKTRIVLDVDRSVKFNSFVLQQPYRVVLDMSEVTWSPKLRNPPTGGLVTGMRFGLFRPGSSRVVLDSKGPVRIAKAFIIPPSGKNRSYRVVVDIAKTSRQAFLMSYKRPVRKPVATAASRPAPVPVPLKRKPARPDAKKLIMIDPGHGGVDPGAMSRSGVWEKHIVLAFARDLRRSLLASGKFRVRLTRDRDVFIRLRDRIAVARRAGADLFISVHADSIGNSKVRGTSVYTLSERASDKEAGALARKENKSDLIAGVDLDDQSNDVVNILIDLAQRETMNESAVFARKLVDELGKTRKLLRNTHRFAGFAVLKAPDIPSVLVELGYLSNRTDERMLRDPRKRKRMAAAMSIAVERYFQRQQALNKP